MTDKEVTFSDILIEPQYSEVDSRSNIPLTSSMGNFELDLPIISANMRHITGKKMAVTMADSGAMGILHRFNEIEEASRELDGVWHRMDADAWAEESPRNVGVSIGVQKEDQARFAALFANEARIFCIDVAHGHHVLVKNMLQWIKRNYGSSHQGVTLIAGNIATAQAAEDLQEWGADVLKVGIGPGKVCMTRRNTGVGVPQFSALKNVAKVAKVPIIADGGITSVGDIAKALIYADSVMVGSLLAGTSETPGSVFRNEDGQLYKVYGGSAAGENKAANGDKPKFVEGIMKTVPFQGHVKHILREIKDGIQSAFSYTGATSVDEFHQKVKWHVISNGSQKESKI